jgi:signal transduction histidine kinase
VDSDEEDLAYLEPSNCINVDQPKMNQVIRNLVSNAIKFTPTGGTVTIRARKVSMEVLRREQARAEEVAKALSRAWSFKNIMPLTTTTKSSRREGARTEMQSSTASEFATSTARTTSAVAANTVRSTSPTAAATGALSHRAALLKLPQINISGGDTLHPSSEMVGVVLIEVIDSGAGMAPEDQKRLFKEVIQFNPNELQVDYHNIKMRYIKYVCA